MIRLNKKYYEKSAGENPLLGRLVVLVIVLMFFCCFDCQAAALSPIAIAKRLQATYDRTTSMSAKFHQIAFISMNRRKREAEGSVIILKPGRIRWDYSAPDRQVLVGDAKKILMYFAKANQMIVRPISDYLQSDVTYAFFTGSGNILRDFDVSAPDEQVQRSTTAGNDKNKKDYCIKLVPRDTHPQVDFIHLWVDPDSFQITRLKIVDQFGSVTDLFFSDIKLNPKVPIDTFSFTPPPGTEIIRE